jgi:hypothetical protein
MNRKPILVRAFEVPVAACLSRDGARGNRAIQSQLVEISAVFLGRVGVVYPTPVRAEPVEALSFSFQRPEKEGQPFDRLRANGLA